MKTRILSLVSALLFFTTSITPSIAGSIDFFGNSAIYVNGQWYYCGNNTMSWCNGGAFNNNNLGTLSSISLGGQSQVYEQDNNNPVCWNGGYVEMHYRISQGTQEMFSSTLNLQYVEMRGSNNFFQLGGEPMVAQDITISSLAAGTYNLEIWFKVPGQDIWDSNNGANYVATFTKENVSISLFDDSDYNSTTLEDYLDNTVDLVIKGRSFIHDGYWNTICLPFSLDDFTGTPLEGATVKSFLSSEFDETTSTLTLNFSEELSSIEAGYPYLVMWNDQQTVNDPTFYNVTITETNAYSSGDGSATFIGCIDPITWPATKRILYLGAENTLYYPEQEIIIGAFRAYFELNLPDANQVKAFHMNLGDETTGIKAVSQLSTLNSELIPYFSLDGRRLTDKPSTAGLYIHNGRKVLIK